MHIHTHRRTRLATALLSAALLPLAALADGTATMQTGDEVTQVSWQENGAVRINGQGESHYMLIRDGKAYAVTQDDGQPQVMELGGMLKAFATLAQDSGQLQALPERVDDVKPLGRDETVAGIRGQVYQITITDKAGKAKTEEAVLTGDPLVTEMTGAYLKSVQSMFGPEVAGNLGTALPADRRGILRVGRDFALKTISADKPAASTFALPAEPVNMQQLMQGLSGLQKK